MTAVTKEIKKNESKNEDEKINYENVLKIGYFQLQTKSFWISLISILCLFVLTIIIINFYFYNKTIDIVFDHEESIIKLVLTQSK